MDDFGYGIVKALVTDIDPDHKVKEAMNEINAAQRLRVAAAEKGEADRILKVKAAEAEAQSKALQGKGIADQRKAIVDGLRRSTDSGHRPTVRWLAGTPFLYSYTGAGPDEVRADLVDRLGPVGGELDISVATMTTDLQSWNHAKIVAVDGRRAIVGGHNQWAASYLTSTPVSDVSMRVMGCAARAAPGETGVTDRRMPVCSAASTTVPHCWHSPHRPTHLRALQPHSVHR